MALICESCRMPSGFGSCPECNRIHEEKIAWIVEQAAEGRAAAERFRRVREDLDLSRAQSDPIHPED
jgi:predicted Fe-S protein YdhL (DUF1289 family)